MPSSDPMRGGAIWCEAHGWWECTKLSKTSGMRCHGNAIRGLDACRMHVGKRASLAKAQGQAVTAFSALGGHQVVSATEAVLGMLQMSWLRVHLYAGLLEAQVAAQGGSPDSLDEAVDEDRQPTTGGLVGHVYGAAGKDGSIYAQSEAVRALAVLEAQERDRCVRYAKTAHDMGIAEAQIELMADRGAELAQMMRLLATGLLRELVAWLAGVDEYREPAILQEAVTRMWPRWQATQAPLALRAIKGG